MGKTTSTIIAILSCICFVCSCEKHEDILFDTPFVTVTGADKISTGMVVDKDGNNLLTELCVSINVSKNYNSEAVEIEYELIVGDGLKEGTDFKVQSSCTSPVTFKTGTYDMPIRILWYRTPSFDASKDNTLTVKLTKSSIPEMVIGSPGLERTKKDRFVFTKQ